jgi:hypothetical protein
MYRGVADSKNTTGQRRLTTFMPGNGYLINYSFKSISTAFYQYQMVTG